MGDRSAYVELLRDPRWQKKRLKILERDGWACRLCGDAKKTLSVHHRYYAKGIDPWDYEDDSLVTACDACHEILDERRRALVHAIGLIPIIEDERMLAYVNARVGLQVEGRWLVPVGSLEAAIGVATAVYGIPYETVRAAVVGGVVNVADLSSAEAEKYAQSLGSGGEPA